MTDKPLTGDEAVEIQIAATTGQPNPIDTEEGRELYENILMQIAAKPDTNWDVARN